MGMIITGSALVIATLFDLKNKKIPNIFNFFLCLVSICFSLTIRNISIGKIFTVLVTAFICTYPLYFYHALGAGDVKLFIGTRLFLSHYNWLMLISISLMIAAGIFIVRLIVTKQLDFKTFHYYRFTPYILMSYLIVLNFF